MWGSHYVHIKFGCFLVNQSHVDLDHLKNLRGQLWMTISRGLQRVHWGPERPVGLVAGGELGLGGSSYSLSKGTATSFSGRL